MARRRSLRTTLTLATGFIVTLALVTAAALVWTTTRLHASTDAAAEAVESVHALDDAEIDLFLHGRATDPVVALGFVNTLRQRLAAARGFVTSPEEGRTLDDAVTQLEAYFAAAAAGATEAELRERQASAYAALESVVAINLAQARAERAEAQRWNAIANVTAIGLGCLLVVTAIVTLAWLRHRAFRSVLQLGRAMRRFGRGDRSARAEETGPAELRDMAVRFNEMAAALIGQRDAQLAVLGGVAHDLRQPLSALVMSTSALDPERMSPDRLRRMIELSNRQTRQMERMIQDFLDMAKLEAGRFELEPAPEDLRKLVRDAVSTHFAPALPERIVLHLPDRPVRVRCDAMRVEQVVTNLVSNALKYSPAEAPVDVVLEAAGDRAIVRVIDRGPGIPVEEQARVFEPFRRGTATRMVPGIGLGLFVARRIIEAHGGELTVDSAAGRGAEFVVALPLPRPGTTDAAEAAPRILDA
jgi:signal transduction histidine kinase